MEHFICASVQFHIVLNDCYHTVCTYCSIDLDSNGILGSTPQLNYSGTNSFGGMVENLYMIGFSPKLDLAQSDKNLLQSDYGKDVNKEEFRYEKTIVNGLSMNDLKGSIIIGENYVITIMDKTDYTGIIEGEAMIEKIYQDENNWTASISIDYMGGKQTIKWTYQGNNQKYKTNAGVLIYEGLGSVIEYPLNRVEK